MILAAQLYHKDPATKFLVTGQRIESMNSSGVDPADTSWDILTRLGVPESSIERIGGKNTSEEMQNLGARFKDSSLRIGSADIRLASATSDPFGGSQRTEDGSASRRFSIIAARANSDDSVSVSKPSFPTARPLAVRGHLPRNTSAC
jgi:hypothetical protein